MITGNVDRLSDDELDLLLWALSSDIEGDVGSRSSMGGILDKSALGYEAVKHARLKRIRTVAGPGGGGITEDVGFRNGQIFVKTPRPEKSDNSMEAAMMVAAGKDKAVRAVMEAIGSHRETLWRCYAWKRPPEVQASLHAFGDLAPLVAETAAAERSRVAAMDGTETPLAFCQALSARVTSAQAGQGNLDPEDAIAMQLIVDEAEPKLAEACRVVKSALRRHAAQLRRRRDQQRADFAGRQIGNLNADGTTREGT